MVNGINFGVADVKQGSYGNIHRIGTAENGRALYSVIDSFGEENTKLSVAKEDIDSFERAYTDIINTAPQIQKYVNENSSEADIKKRRNMSRLIVGVFGLAGVAIPIALTKKANVSTLKQILATVAGVVVGLSLGFTASLIATTPPGSYKFAKANRTFSRLDIKPVKEVKED